MSDDKCLSCGEQHHSWELSDRVVAEMRKRTGITSPIHDAVIGDAVYHILIDSFRWQLHWGRPEDEAIAWLTSKDGPASAIGTLMGAMESRVQHGGDAALTRFIEKNGPGVYEFEITEREGSDA